MTLININPEMPNYIALSTDIDGGKIDGVHPGGIVYVTDLQQLYIADDDMDLVEYIYPIVREVTGTVTTVGVEFTRPANITAYDIGDAVTNSASTTIPMEFANLVGVTGGNGIIKTVRLETDQKSITPRIRVHLFSDKTSLTVSADNAAWKDVYADSAKRLGYIDLAAMVTGADAAASNVSYSFSSALSFPVHAITGSRSIYAVLETLDAFTPTSEEKFYLYISLQNS